MIGIDGDEAVLAYLRGRGPCTLTVRELATGTGIPRVTARASVAALSVDGLVCLIINGDETVYRVRHLHAAPGRCEYSLACTISEAPE
jgi:hypothetical protein